MNEKKGMALHTKIVIGLIVGAVAGGTANSILGAGAPNLTFAADQITNPIGTVFLRLLLLLVIPLVFSSLVLGVAGLPLATTTQPGRRGPADVGRRLEAQYGKTAEETVATTTSGPKVTDTPLMKVVKTIVPTNIFFSIGKETPDMLGLMFFALFLGICLSGVPAETSAPLLGALEGVFAAVERGIQIVMMLAPYAVFCLLFTMTAKFGFGLLASLGWFVATVLL